MKDTIALVRQRESWDCGIACLAMVARKSYDEVVAALPANTVNNAKTLQPPGIPSSHITALLGMYLGLATKDRFVAPKLADNALDRRAIVLTRGHYIVALPGGAVLDPACDQLRHVDEYGECFKVWEIVDCVGLQSELEAALIATVCAHEALLWSRGCTCTICAQYRAKPTVGEAREQQGKEN